MMNSFSGYYKTMCAKAIEIQRLWPELDRPEQERDYYCPKGEYTDGFVDSYEMRQLPKEDEKEFFKNNIWLPQEFQIIQRLFPRIACAVPGIIKNLNNAYYEYWESKRVEPFLNEHFQDREKDHARAMMFIMEYWFKKEWSDHDANWVGRGSR